MYGLISNSQSGMLASVYGKRTFVLEGGVAVSLRSPTQILEGTEMLERKDWLVLFLGLPAESYPVDQIRVMKGMFLWSKEGPQEAQQLYRFEPYNYGPFDTTVYRDLDVLESEGLIGVESYVGNRQRRYFLTPAGEQRASQLSARVLPKAMAKLRDIKRHVTSLPFADLLKSIYQRYPDYAVNSVARV